MTTTTNGNGVPLWVKLLEKYGVPTVLLAAVLYFLWPEHVRFLDKISTQQEKITEQQTRQVGVLETTSETLKDVQHSTERLESRIEAAIERAP